MCILHIVGLLVFLQLLHRAVGTLDDGVVQHTAEGGADVGEIFLAELCLLCLFLRGQLADLRLAREVVDAFDLCLFHSLI